MHSLYQDAQPNGVDRDKHLELSQLWNTAAIKSRFYLNQKGSDSEQAWMLDKAAYWLKQINWSDEEAIRRGIDLDSVEQRIRTLIEQG
jgi:hypothetical protein